MTGKALEATVGLFVLAGVAALGFLALRVGNLGTETVGPTFTVTARFDNIGGLTPRAPVTLAGVRIGRVAGITIDKRNYSAIVEMAIDGRYDNLPADSSASILTSGLLGAQYVGITAGGEEEALKQGDRIQLTQSAVVLENLIGQLLFSKAGGEGQ
jgi:phospholipid/cholesterol/gamma-HCH transport system substrate-binding protein